MMYNEPNIFRRIWAALRHRCAYHPDQELEERHESGLGYYDGSLYYICPQCNADLERIKRLTDDRS